MPRVDHYELGEAIAQGPAGSLVLAQDTRSGRRVCLRLLSPEFAAQPELRDRFALEAQTLSRLRHPHLVGVEGRGESSQGPYLVLTVLPRETLVTRLMSGPLPDQDAAELVRKLALALEHAHQSGLLHRDVRPENVLLDEQGDPRLAGFGLVLDLDPKASGRLNPAGFCVSQPGFAAPELLAEAWDKVGPTVDVFGLGATLYAALTGVPPSTAGTPAAVLADHFQGGVRPLLELAPSVDPQLAAIVRRSLECDPRARFASADALARALARFLLQPARITRSARAASTSSAKLLVPAVLGFSLVVGLGGGLLLREWSAGGGAPAPSSPAQAPAQAPSSLPPPEPTSPLATATPTPSPTVGQAARDLVLRGQQSLQRGELREAWELFSEARELAPESAGAWGGSALASYQQGELPRAVDEFERAVELQPRTADFHYGLAQSLRRTGRRADARNEYLRVVQLDPRHADALNWLSGFLLDEGRLEESIEAATRALESNPGHGFAYYNRGTAMLQQGRPREALDDFDRSVRLLPDHASGYSNRAVAHKRLEEFDAALRDYRLAIELAPRSPVYPSNRANLLRTLGRHEEAVVDYGHALSLREEFGLRIARARSLLALGRRAEAEEDLRHVIDESPLGSPAASEARELYANQFR